MPALMQGYDVAYRFSPGLLSLNNNKLCTAANSTSYKIIILRPLQRGGFGGI
jgi:hypothetical protein